MSREEIVQKFINNPIYMTNGAGFLSKQWNCKKSDIFEARDRVRAMNKELDLKDKPFKRMFFDIETSYNVIADFACGWNKSIGPHQILKERAIICICWKWEDEDKVNYLKWDDNQCDKKMLTEFSKEIERADEVIGHNGDKFDLRWLRGRCIIHQLPFPTYVKSLDTLKKVRAAGYFNSNKLDYLGKILLGHGKVDTGGFQLWVDICENKCKEAMHKMILYCKNDVVLLQDVFDKLSPYITHNTHVGVADGGEKYTCKGCGGSNIEFKKNVYTPTGNVQRLVECRDCRVDFKLSNQVWKNYLKG